MYFSRFQVIKSLMCTNCCNLEKVHASPIENDYKIKNVYVFIIKPKDESKSG